MDKIGAIDAKSSMFIWRINNFTSIRRQVGEYIESPYFTIGEIASNTLKWQVVLYPFGKNDECQDFLSAYLICFFCGDIYEVDISYELFLWGSESGTNVYNNVKLTSANTTTGYSKFKQRNGQDIQNNLYLGNDTLTIACRINEITAHCTDKINQHAELIASFESLFLCDILSDVIIEVEEKQLKAHKIILAGRSEVFLAMFKHNTVENKENIIRISDFSYDVMKEVLRFIYIGKVENLETHKEDLLVAADKYNLTYLRRLCEQSICMDMRANNIWEILNMSDLYNCDDLKTKAVNYILDNTEEVFEYPSAFKQVSESNPNLIRELVRVAARRCNAVKS